MALIHEQLVKINREISAIGKNQRNDSQKFNFRGIDDVYNELHDLFAKHGVLCLPETLELLRGERTNKNGGAVFSVTLRMRYTFVAEDGSSCAMVIDGEGMDSGDKATSKANSIAHKQAFFQMFLIPTKDMPDPDRESYEIQNNVNKSESTHQKQKSSIHQHGTFSQAEVSRVAEQLKQRWDEGSIDGIGETLRAECRNNPEFMAAVAGLLDLDIKNEIRTQLVSAKGKK